MRSGCRKSGINFHPPPARLTIRRRRESRNSHASACHRCDYPHHSYSNLSPCLCPCYSSDVFRFEKKTYKHASKESRSSVVRILIGEAEKRQPSKRGGHKKHKRIWTEQDASSSACQLMFFPTRRRSCTCHVCTVWKGKVRDGKR